MGLNEERQIKQVKNENKKLVKKLEILQEQLMSFEAISAQLDHEISSIEIKQQEIEAAANKEIAKNDEYR